MFEDITDLTSTCYKQITQLSNSLSLRGKGLKSNIIAESEIFSARCSPLDSSNSINFSISPRRTETDENSLRTRSSPGFLVSHGISTVVRVP